MALASGGSVISRHAATRPPWKALLGIPQEVIVAIFCKERAALLAASSATIAEARDRMLKELRLYRQLLKGGVRLSDYARVHLFPWVYTLDWLLTAPQLDLEEVATLFA